MTLREVHKYMRSNMINGRARKFVQGAKLNILKKIQKITFLHMQFSYIYQIIYIILINTNIFLTPNYHEINIYYFF